VTAGAGRGGQRHAAWGAIRHREGCGVAADDLLRETLNWNGNIEPWPELDPLVGGMISVFAPIAMARVGGG
jgi:hypothetical protein